MEVLALLDPSAGGPQGPQVYERSNEDARVILRAREAAWIQVSSPSGDYAFTRTLQPGEAVLVPNRPDLELWTGNAGGLEIIVDGTPLAALAPGGAVRRHVSLDPERLRAARWSAEPAPRARRSGALVVPGETRMMRVACEGRSWLR